MTMTSNDKSGGKSGPNSGLAARKAALAALSSVMENGETLDQALEDAFGGAGRAGNALAPRDRAFVHQLVATTLRRLGQTDRVIKKFLQKPLPKRAESARHILRLGAVQILFLNVSAHAVVDTSVTLASGDRNPNVRRLKGLVNAVLRRITEQKDDLLAAVEGEPLGNLPMWLRKSWLAYLGEKKTQAVAGAILQDPPLDLTPNLAKAEGDDNEAGEKLAQTLVRSLDGALLANGSVRLQSGGRIEELPGFKEGKWWVQDAAATFPARLLGDVRGKFVADLCAAPGGKTLQLAANGARVTAVDKSAKRLERLKENLLRTGLSADVVTSDVLTWTPEAPPHAILLDAPCSATGTMRRHPDIARTRSAADIPPLVELQAKMLDHAFGLLREGGRLVYSVCSLQREEGAAQIDAFLARTPNATRAAVSPAEMAGLAEAITGDGDVLTLPCYWPAKDNSTNHEKGGPEKGSPEKGGMDGFYIARIEKR